MLAYEEADTTLHDFIARRGALGERLSLDLSRQLVCGVRSIHSKGIWHRDLKPANLLIRFVSDAPCLRLLVADFGGACRLPPPGSSIQPEFLDKYWLERARFPLTPRRSTPPYAAPEQAISQTRVHT